MHRIIFTRGWEDEDVRGGDVPRRVQRAVQRVLREALVRREAVRHEAQRRLGLRGHEAGGQDAGHGGRRQHAAHAAQLAQRARRQRQVLARQQPAPACNTRPVSTRLLTEYTSPR